jgi:hypothetical protein
MKLKAKTNNACVNKEHMRYLPIGPCHSLKGKKAFLERLTSSKNGDTKDIQKTS